MWITSLLYCANFRMSSLQYVVFLLKGCPHKSTNDMGRNAISLSSRSSGRFQLSATTNESDPLYLGIDFGTSGARASVIDSIPASAFLTCSPFLEDDTPVHESRSRYELKEGELWDAAWKRLNLNLEFFIDWS